MWRDPRVLRCILLQHHVHARTKLGPDQRAAQEHKTFANLLDISAYLFSLGRILPPSSQQEIVAAFSLEIGMSDSYQTKSHTVV